MLGVRLSSDYGISWDEPAMRRHGNDGLSYVSNFDFKSSFTPFEWESKYHPITFELMLQIVEKVLGEGDIAKEYQRRHLFTFIGFFLSTVVFLILSWDYLKSRMFAALAFLCLILHPRIFADAFYNPKDIPFLMSYIFGAYTLFQFLRKKNDSSAFIHGIACGLAVSLRIAGVFLIAATILVFCASLLSDRKIRNQKPYLIFAVSATFFTILFWPVLWSNPVGEFLQALQHLGKFPLDIPVLFRGELLSSMRLPVSYLPNWFLITTPIAFSLVIVVGLVSLLYVLGKQIKKFSFDHVDLAMIFLAFAPVAAVMVQRSVLYDGWRHLFFVYPILLLVGFRVLMLLKNNFTHVFGLRYLPQLLIAGVVVNLLSTLVFLIQSHPYQNVYFNFIPGSNLTEVRKLFELDYWGLSYRQGLEYILKQDQREKIKVASNTLPGFYNTFILREQDRKRVQFVRNPKEADYYMDNFRFRPEGINIGTKIYAIEVDGGEILVIRKL